MFAVCLFEMVVSHGVPGVCAMHTGISVTSSSCPLPAYQGYHLAYLMPALSCQHALQDSLPSCICLSVCFLLHGAHSSSPQFPPSTNNRLLQGLGLKDHFLFSVIPSTLCICGCLNDRCLLPYPCMNFFLRE